MELKNNFAATSSNHNIDNGSRFVLGEDRDIYFAIGGSARSRATDKKTWGTRRGKNGVEIGRKRRRRKMAESGEDLQRRC